MSIEDEIKVTTRAEVWIMLALLQRHPYQQMSSTIAHVLSANGAHDVELREIYYLLDCMKTGGILVTNNDYWSLTEKGYKRAVSLRDNLKSLIVGVR